MAEASPPVPVSLPQAIKKTSKSKNTWVRVLKYAGIRILTLSITVVIGLYLTILVANMGGYADQIRMSRIREDVTMQAMNDPSMKKMDPEVRQKKINDTIQLRAKQMGMDKPFIVRSFSFLTDALTLNLGRAENMTSNSGSNSVRLIILERLPATLILFATSDIILFFISLVFALVLSRQYGSIFDKLSVTLTPLSSAPGWFYGIFLILIFCSVLKVLPFGGMVSSPPPPTTAEYLLSLGVHMILPVLASTVSQVFLNIFTWRTFFLIYSSEDYVEMAKIKGLSDRDINNRYILRPTLPTIITSFALLVINSWLGAPIFETIFSWPGLGSSMFRAIGLFDTSVIVGMTVIFSYLLAITVFLLDFIYALVDPRVKVGEEARS